MENKKWYAVDVMLTNRCSMKCEYCIENEYDNYHINTDNDNKEYTELKYIYGAANLH